jgi:hypothetical protein
LIERQAKPVVGFPFVKVSIDVGKDGKMSGSTRLQVYCFILSGSLPDDGATQSAMPGCYIERVKGQIVLRMSCMWIDGEHERLVLSYSLVGANSG